MVNKITAHLPLFLQLQQHPAAQPPLDALAHIKAPSKVHDAAVWKVAEIQIQMLFDGLVRHAACCTRGCTQGTD